MKNITHGHLSLFAQLAEKDRIQIRSENERINEWEFLRDKNLISIFESGRRGTLIIHLTSHGESSLKELLSILDQEPNP